MSFLHRWHLIPLKWLKSRTALATSKFYDRNCCLCWRSQKVFFKSEYLWIGQRLICLIYQTIQSKFIVQLFMSLLLMMYKTPLPVFLARTHVVVYSDTSYNKCLHETYWSVNLISDFLINLSILLASIHNWMKNSKVKFAMVMAENFPVQAEVLIIPVYWRYLLPMPKNNLVVFNFHKIEYNYISLSN